MREPIFKVLVIEFIASYEFDDDAARKDNTSKPIKYRLGGHWQELSVVDLAIHLGLYIEDDIRHRAFQTFLEHCAVWKSDQNKPNRDLGRLRFQTIFRLKHKSEPVKIPLS